MIADVWDYAQETDHGFDHVLRWVRALNTLGAIEDMTSAEAQGYADQYLPERWNPVVAELEEVGGCGHAQPGPGGGYPGSRTTGHFTGNQQRPPEASWSASPSTASSPTPTATT